MQTIWSNQVELTKSAEKLDEQFCVLARLSIRFINDLAIRISSDNVINEDVLEKYFKEWAAFRTRPDFRKFMLEWFLGKELKDLPAAPEVPSPEAEEPQEPQEFGGDYAKQVSSVGDKTVVQTKQPDRIIDQTDAVPPGQNLDGPTSPEERCHDTTVP